MALRHWNHERRFAMFRFSLRSTVKRSVAIIVLASCVVLVGCATYRAVTDPTSGKVYYTTKVKKQRSGVVTFTDARTGAKVTLQSSEIQKISMKEYKQGVKKD